MLTIQALPSAGLVHPQLAFLPQAAPRAVPIAPQGFKPTNKRTRSPSPPPSVPVSMYHQGYAYKPQTIPNTSYQQPPQQQSKYLTILLFVSYVMLILFIEDDNRRGHELVRAVLWNSEYKIKYEVVFNS